MIDFLFENPLHGKLKDLPCIKSVLSDHPSLVKRVDTSYCQYGYAYQKPTVLIGTLLNLNLVPCCPKPPCQELQARATHRAHCSDATVEQKNSLPPALVDCILKAWIERHEGADVSNFLFIDVFCGYGSFEKRIKQAWPQVLVYSNDISKSRTHADQNLDMSASVFSPTVLLMFALNKLFPDDEKDIASHPGGAVGYVNDSHIAVLFHCSTPCTTYSTMALATHRHAGTAAPKSDAAQKDDDMNASLIACFTRICLTPPSPPTDSKLDLPTGIHKLPYGKYRGQVNDIVFSAINPGSSCRKVRYTSSFSTVEHAARAREEMAAKMRAEYDAIILERVKNDPSVRDLDEGPKDLSIATPRKAYWMCSKMTSFHPKRMVVTNSGKQGLRWALACVYCSPNETSVARADSRNTNEEPACTTHGARCPHGRQPGSCMECTHAIGKPIPMKFCSRGCGTILNRNRERSAGGNGLCPSCEQSLAKEAADAGTSAAPATKRWEDVVAEKLVALVTDEEGNQIPYEMRDDMRYMFGSNRVIYKGECSTSHTRRPDLLWLKRDEGNARIVAAVMVEVDEDSHSSRDPECEGGKVHDTFQCIVKLAQDERSEEEEAVMPKVTFLRFNPNKCDAPGRGRKAAPIPLDTRIRVLASRVRSLLNASSSELKDASRRGMHMRPYLELLYYDTVRGKANLDYYERHADAFVLTRNRCPVTTV